jgi:hypothetical protein
MRNSARFILLLVLLLGVTDGCRRKGGKGPYLGPVPAHAP